ncbi:uncharacterized protein [Rutidosis leptorrhynchoides]|uniref:uncharacterized protein isoform X2 n=1 Tax=Rutidosis leptorrhynchoides TaxID=125765 RepID=UPI003A9A0A29
MMEEEEEGEDRLSALPDNLIFDILFHIPDETLTQSAITTFTLSKRWCALWTEYFILEYQNPSNSFWPSALPHSGYVAETLVNCRRSNLSKFHLSGKCNNLLKPHVNNWIRVKNLVITGYGDLQADECPYILEIDAPYILSLTIGGCLLVWNLLLVNVSSLVKANLNFSKCKKWETIDEEMFGLIISLLHAKELNIGSLCNKVFSRLEDKGFTFPSNVKVLDSPNVANSLLWWPDSDDDSECFHIRERNAGPFAGRITVNLLKDQTKVEDRISALPDGILIEILSRLPETKYAIRTSTLSKRWIHLWTYTRNLIFQRDFGNDFLASDFFPAVNKTLTQCCETKLYKFEMHCCRGYNNQFELHVKDCIRYAVTRNAEEIYLELFNDRLEAEFVSDEFFYINSSITKLTLKGCIFTHTGAICWENLKSLCIQRGIINEDLIENIQTGSPMLETLELENCSGYMRLNITSKSIKNLIFSGYLDVEDEENVFDIIEINAPNILSLTISGELLLDKLVLLNVASLVNAHLDYSNDDIPIIAQERILKEFIISLQHVKELKIGIDCFKAFFNLKATGFAFPCNLKILDSLDGIADWSDWSSDDDDSDLDSSTNGDWKEL